MEANYIFGVGGNNWIERGVGLSEKLGELRLRGLAIHLGDEDGVGLQMDAVEPACVERSKRPSWFALRVGDGDVVDRDAGQMNGDIFAAVVRRLAVSLGSFGAVKAAQPGNDDHASVLLLEEIDDGGGFQACGRDRLSRETSCRLSE